MSLPDLGYVNPTWPAGADRAHYLNMARDCRPELRDDLAKAIATIAFGSKGFVTSEPVVGFEREAHTGLIHMGEAA